MFEFKYPTENYQVTAGFGIRFLAFFFDIIVYILFMLPFSLLKWIYEFELSDYTKFFIFTMYFVLFTWKYGRTVGKFNTELKVETNSGKKISLAQSFLRMIFNWTFLIIPIIYLTISLKLTNIDDLLLAKDTEIIKQLMSLSAILGIFIGIFVLFILDIFFILIRKDKKALHDLISGTRCVRK